MKIVASAIPMQLRPYQSSDYDSLLDICLKTGAHGRDASENCVHPGLLGSYFAVPYAVFDPGLCLVLEDGAGPCGYVQGAADTRTFLAWFNTTWLPQIRPEFAGLTAPENAADGWLLKQLGSDLPAPVFVDDYPAHVHIDLLDRAQKHGWGRRMIEAWSALAAKRGATAFFLGVSRHNENAVAFYRHIGMHEISAEPWGWHFGMEVAPVLHSNR